MPGTRVVLADDEVLLREGIAKLLDAAGYQVVGQAANPNELRALVREQSPELVVVDIRMPPTHTTEGLEAARAIRAEFSEIGILLLSAHVEIPAAMELLKNGDRVGYLLKDRVMNVDDFVESVERIARGGSVVDPVLVQELVSHKLRDDPLSQLTVRERDVLALMAEGRSNSGISHRLWITEGAVEKHIHRILAKLDLPPASGDDHRRVLAVVAYLNARAGGQGQRLPQH
jgi:serine/threonine-protein kinase PknK